MEEYISHDTRQLFVEKERYTDILSRTIPAAVHSDPGSNMADGEGAWVPTYYDQVTLMMLRVCNMSAIVEQCTPTEALGVRRTSFINNFN